MDWIAVIATVIMLISILGLTVSVVLSSDIAVIQKLGIPKQDLVLEPWLSGIIGYLAITCILLFIQWRKERNSKGA